MIIPMPPPPAIANVAYHGKLITDSLCYGLYGVGGVGVGGVGVGVGGVGLGS